MSKKCQKSNKYFSRIKYYTNESNDAISKAKDPYRFESLLDFASFRARAYVILSQKLYTIGVK